MTRLVAVAPVPAMYHTPIYRSLASTLGEQFTAVFQHGGYARPAHDPAWGAEVHFDTGILDGYERVVLDPERNQSTWRNCWALSRELRRLKPDAIFVNSHRGAFCRAAIETGRMLGARVVLRSTPYDESGRSLVSTLGREVFLRASYHSVDAFAAVGTMARMHFEHYSGRPQAVYASPYCTDEYFLRPLSRRKAALREQLRHRHGVGLDEFVFLACGRLHSVKRIDWTLRAFRRFRQEHRARLLLVGNGPLSSLVESAVAQFPEDILWLGFQDRKGVAQAMAGSDALLLPSLTERWGVVVNEALMFQVPVVASTGVAAAIDLIQEGSTGFTFPVNDEEAFYRGVQGVFELGRAIGPAEEVSFTRLTDRFTAANAARGVLQGAEVARS